MVRIPVSAILLSERPEEKSREKSRSRIRVRQERERVTSKRRERREDLTRPAGERGMVTRIGSVRLEEDD